MVPRDGLVAEYLCSGDGVDTSGGSHHAVVHGAVPIPDRFGAPASALAFDGRSWLAAATPPTAGATATSVSVWVKFDRRAMKGWTNCIIAQDDGNDADQSRRSFQLSCDNGRVVWHRMIQSRDPLDGRRVVPGVWYHFVGIAADGEHRLYADGVLLDAVQGPFASHADQPLHIGRKGTDEKHFFFRGAIDDVRIYNRALSDAEITALFTERGFAKAPRRASGEISGRWGRDGIVHLDLAHDGHGRVTGRIMGGRPSNMADVSKGTFDRATGRFALEGVAPHQDTGVPVDFRFEGVVDGDEIATVLHAASRDGTLDHHGNHIVSRRGARRRWWRDSRLREVITGRLVRLHRVWWSRTRPSPAHNEQGLRERGESITDFVIRDATIDDIPALSRVHVTAWNATYNTQNGPSVALRESQWRQTFANQDGNWFVLVVVNAKAEIIGFTRGIKRRNGTGDFNKLYLLWEYHRLGLGRRLVKELVARFTAMGVTRMTGFVEPGNPSCAFFEKIGGVWARDEAGRINHSCYVWDLAEVGRRLEIAASAVGATGRRPV